MVFRVGCSGWSYPHWRNVFYPPGLRQVDWFRHYSSVFDTVEINNSFYRTPSEETFRGWASRAPEGFLYSVKVNRAITQYHKLDAASYGLFEQFLARAEKLESAFGPLLLQLPPSLGPDMDRLHAFLSQPAAGRHPMAIEFRHEGWFTNDLFDLLRGFGVALVLSDFKDLPIPHVATAPWLYVRLHGTSGRYFGSYSDEELQRWAVLIKDLSSDGFIYFNNDVGGAAPRDALRLRQLLQQASPSTSS